MIATGYQTQLTAKRTLATARIERFGLTCDVLRPSTTLSDAGFPVDSETTVENDVACLVVRSRDRRSDQEEVVAGEVQAHGPLTVILPWDTDVRETDVISVAPASGSPRRLSVVGGSGDIPGRIVRTVQVVEVNPGGSA